MALGNTYPWRREFATAARFQSRLKNKSVKPSSFWSHFFCDLLNNLSLHGLHHIAKEDKLICERILWALVTLLASLGMAVTCYNSYLNYRHPSMTTTLKTTRNECANIPFPSITICDTSRVDWLRATNLSIKDFPNSDVSKDHLLVLLQALSDMSFGDFDFMDHLSAANLTSKDFGNIEISKLLQKVQRSCSEVFYEQCWWRETFYNCCELFEVQITDLGFCYSFNSDLSEKSKKQSWGYGLEKNYWIDGFGQVRPRRSAASGPWSGLRFTVEVMTPEQLPSGTNLIPGIMFYLEEPRSFPNSENQHVDPASFVDIRVQGITQQAKERVQTLDYEDRNCLFHRERIGWTGVYNERNCQVECQRDYAIKYCNCSPSFLFIDDDDDPRYPPCSVKGLNCLKRFNEVFNSKIPNVKQEMFFSGVKEGMQCDCPAECNSQQYMFDSSISQTQNLTQIGFDIHYRGQQYNTLYTSDVVGGTMEFIVAIGGIAGLFLGGSLLSGVELVYFLTFRLFYHWRKSRKVKPTIKLNNKITFIK